MARDSASPAANSASSDEDLAQFLAGLRQRYNLDLVDTAATPAAAAASPSQQAVAASARHAAIAGLLSTDAEVLGLPQTAPSGMQQGAASPSLRSGQLTEAPVAASPPSRLQTTTAGAEGAEALPSPAAASESGSCSTPQPQRTSASQLAVAAGVTPVGAAAGAAAGTRAAAEAPAGGVGAVAAAATPHSTAAMPAARHGAQHRGLAAAQQEAIGMEPHAAAGPMHVSPAAAEASPVAAAAAAPAAAEMLTRSVSGSSLSSVAQPLLEAFEAATDGDTQQQQQQQPAAAVGPVSPARPLLGAWAARAAAAAAAVIKPAASPVAAAGDARAAAQRDVQEAAAAASPARAAGAAEQTSRSSKAAPAQAQAAADTAGDGGAPPPGDAAAGLQSQHEQVAPGTASTANWEHLSAQLSAAGFGHLAMLQQQQQQQQRQKQQQVPELSGLHDSLSKVLHEYKTRDALLQQLLSERDEVRRATKRSGAETNRLEREREEALRTAARLKAELSDVRAKEIPALEQRHKDALGKLSSEVARLKHGLKEAEAAAAAAAQAEAAAASGKPALQVQMQEAVRERERLRLECARLDNELSRQKQLVKDLEKAAAAAQADAKASADQAGLLEKQLRQLKQAAAEEQAAAAAELNKARHAAREAEAQLSELKAAATAAAAGSSAESELRRQLAAARTQHEEQQAHLTSELQGLRVQLLQMQAAVSRAESAAQADSNAATHAAKELALQEKLHKSEAAKLIAEVKQARDTVQMLQAKVVQADAAAAEQAAAAAAAESEAREAADRAAAAILELDRLRGSSTQQQQQLGEQLQDGKRALAECEQQLASTQAELRRLRSAAGFAADNTAAAAAVSATAAAETAAAGTGALTAEGSTSSAVGLEPQGPARVVLAGQSINRPGKAAATAAAAGGIDLAAALSRAVAAEAAAATAEAALVGLRYKCMQLEMSCSRKEQELEALRDKLGQKVTREERRLARDKAAYQRIKQAYVASGGAAAGRRAAAAATAAAGPGGGGWQLSTVDVVGAAASAVGARGRSNAAGAVAAAARELRPVELVGIYEQQKEALEKELAAAKAEVRVLGGQLREAQNLLISRDRATAAAAAAVGVKGSALALLGDSTALAAAQKKAAELQRELCTVRAEAASALREAAKRLAESEAEAQQLQGDAAALQEELDSRPTAAEQRRLLREIDLLQRKVASQRRQVAARQPGGAAAAGEHALAAAAGDVWVDDDLQGCDTGGGAGRSVKAAVERDKALARLGLHAVEEMPRDVLVDVLQDVCVVLELRDVTLLVPTIKKVAAVAAAIPSVEAFVAQVCEVVLREGLAYSVQAAEPDTGLTPKCVPQVLKHWLQLLQQGELLTQFAAQLQQLLAQRCSPDPDLLSVTVTEAAAPAGAEATAAGAGGVAGLQRVCTLLLQQVQELLRVEAEAVAASDVFGAAKDLMAEQPEGLLQRLVQQVMQQLGVQRLEGLPAAVNRVYVHYSELLNFLKAATSLLALPPDAGPGAVMAALSKLVEQCARPPSKVRQAAAELHAAASQQQQQLFDTAADAAAGASQQQQEAAAAAEGRLLGLLSALGAPDEQQAAARHQELVGRLRRLDQVLPKYQSVVSQLYDKLRVVALDELVPAVEALQQQAAA